MRGTSSSRRPVSTEGQPVQPDLRVLEVDPKTVQHRLAVDNFFIAGVVVLLAVFMIGVMKYVLSPAVKTATNATTSSSRAGGP